MLGRLRLTPFASSLSPLHFACPRTPWMRNLVNTATYGMTQESPEGVVTILFTDIVGSAALKTSLLREV
jgi:class 3 adenylate cyclase